MSGVIEEVGPDTPGFHAGHAVVGTFIMPCGKCRHCSNGHEELCETFFQFNRLSGHLYDGTSRLWRVNGEVIAQYSMGDLAERCVAPVCGIHPLPDGVNLLDAAILGCSGFTATGTVRTTAQLRVSETVAVIGCGGVGSSIIGMAKAHGASRIVAVDVSAAKLAAADLGATDVVNSRETNPVDAVCELTGGRGVDVIFEALGRPDTIENAVMMLDDMGRLVMVGLAARDQVGRIPILHTVRRKIQILGSYGARAGSDMAALLELTTKGMYDPSRVMTNRYTLDEVNRVYADLEAGDIVGRGIIVM